VHVSIVEHVVTSSQTVVTEYTHGGWGGHMWQSVVVVTDVIVVQLVVGHETTVVIVVVTVPTTSVHVVKDCCESATGSTRVKILKRTFKRMFESLTSALERCSTTTKIITLTDAAMRDKRIHGIGGLWKPTIDSKTQRANQ